MRILIALIVIIVGLMAYIRLAPNDAGLWHKLPKVTAPGDTLEAGSFLAVRRITAPAAEVLAAIDTAARATPRTVLAAGDVAEAMLTYRTRSALWGFPDHTTVAVQGDLLVIYGRLRFGQSDLGVNRARIQGWLRAVEGLTAPL